MCAALSGHLACSHCTASCRCLERLHKQRATSGCQVPGSAPHRHGSAWLSACRCALQEAGGRRSQQALCDHGVVRLRAARRSSVSTCSTARNCARQPAHLVGEFVALGRLAQLEQGVQHHLRVAQSGPGLAVSALPFCEALPDDAGAACVASRRRQCGPGAGSAAGAGSVGQAQAQRRRPRSGPGWACTWGPLMNRLRGTHQILCSPAAQVCRSRCQPRQLIRREQSCSHRSSRRLSQAMVQPVQLERPHQQNLPAQHALSARLQAGQQATRHSHTRAHSWESTISSVPSAFATAARSPVSCCMAWTADRAQVQDSY